jgi:hypothetical protein
VAARITLEDCHGAGDEGRRETGGCDDSLAARAGDDDRHGDWLGALDGRVEEEANRAEEEGLSVTAAPSSRGLSSTS